jgi:hypothetical protein
MCDSANRWFAGARLRWLENRSMPEKTRRESRRRRWLYIVQWSESGARSITWPVYQFTCRVHAWLLSRRQGIWRAAQMIERNVIDCRVISQEARPVPTHVAQSCIRRRKSNNLWCRVDSFSSTAATLLLLYWNSYTRQAQHFHSQHH